MRSIVVFSLALGFLLSMSVHAGEPIPVIIDTDVAMGYPGHDVDDGLMLLIAINSPELDILGVTATWGNHVQEKTCAKAKEIVPLAAREAGREDIPVLCGADGPEWLGRETDASRFIAETVKSRPGEVSIVAVGTLTNVATAIQSDPEVAPAIKRVSSMGGTPAPPGRWPFWGMFDLNYGADIEAAQLVMDSGVRFTMASSRLCSRTVMTPKRYWRMEREAPFCRELIKEQARYWHFQTLLTPAKFGTIGFVPWDVTALFHLMHPEEFSDNWMRTRIDDHGWAKRTVVVYEDGLPEGEGINGPTGVDRDAFWEWFFERI